jgi:membrane-bound lytic murein transglycosylase D
MNIKRILTASMAAIIAAVLGTAAYANPKTDNKKKLEEEKRRLLEVIDSLQTELDRYREVVDLTDSLEIEMLAAYGETIERSTEEFQPLEYTAEVSDSLLSIWYSHKQAFAEDDLNLDSVKFASNVPDEVYIERIKKMNSFITLPYNEIVRNYIILYSEKMPTRMAHMLGLCNYYMPIFEEILNRYDMPEELKAMTIIESAMNPRATSRVGAKGMWQFMYGTAKQYGLHIDSFVDERMDPVKSAEAAVQFLQDAYEIFGDWNLAIASYNCGAGNVNKAIRRAGGKRDFWSIWPYLPRETRGYVPAFVGALYTMRYYKEHGIRPEAVGMPVAVDTFYINKQLHLKQVSELTGAPLEELKDLNPQYRHEIIPGHEREYILRLPYNYTNLFIEFEDSVYKHKADVYFNPATIKKIKDGGDGELIIYKVKSGDYLGKIAGKYRVSVAQIKKWNNLKSNDIRVGQRLTIYRGGVVPSSSSSSSSSSSAKTTTSSSSTGSGNKITYTVKSGDVLGRIAEKHGVTLANLKSWNGLTSNNIQIGQKLVIYTKGSAPASTGTSQTAKGESTYTVKSGDSFYSIAKNYPGVSAQNIMDHNGMKSSDLKPGMKLKIPQY